MRQDHLLEEFEGFVEQINGDVAHVTLKTRAGEVLYGEYPVAEFRARGIHERRRFKCRTIDGGLNVEIDMEAIPDREVGEEREQAIAQNVQCLLGGWTWYLSANG